MKKLLLTCILLIGGYLLYAQESTDIDPVELPEDLSQVIRNYESSWRDFDSQGLASLFTEDGFILRPFREPTRGRSEIEKAYRGSGGPLFLSAYAYEQSGDIAYIIGGYRGNEAGNDTGKFTLTLKRVEGKWLIFSDMDNGNIRR